MGESQCHIMNFWWGKRFKDMEALQGSNICKIFFHCDFKWKLLECQLKKNWVEQWIAFYEILKGIFAMTSAADEESRFGQDEIWWLAMRFLHVKYEILPESLPFQCGGLEFYKIIIFVTELCRWLKDTKSNHAPGQLCWLPLLLFSSAWVDKPRGREQSTKAFLRLYFI